MRHWKPVPKFSLLPVLSASPCLTTASRVWRLKRGCRSKISLRLSFRQSKRDRNLVCKYDCLTTARVATTFLSQRRKNVVATLAVVRCVNRLSSHPLQTQAVDCYCLPSIIRQPGKTLLRTP